MNERSRKGMLSTDNLEKLKERVAGYPGPVLSAYPSVNLASVENRDRACSLRPENELKENAVPRSIARRVLEYVEAERPRMRTLALSATGDGPLEAHWLRIELPEEVRYEARCAGATRAPRPRSRRGWKMEAARTEEDRPERARALPHAVLDPVAVRDARLKLVGKEDAGLLRGRPGGMAKLTCF